MPRGLKASVIRTLVSLFATYCGTTGMQIVPRVTTQRDSSDAACYQTWGLEAWPLMETEKRSRLGRLECDLRQWSGTRAFALLRRAEKHTLHSDQNRTILSLAAYSEHTASPQKRLANTDL